MNKWYHLDGADGDVVISTRVRLSRNIGEYPFPWRLDAQGKEKVAEEVKKALFENDEFGLSFIEMKNLSRQQAISLAERHVISPEFTERAEGSALILSEDEGISIMLCEEDHIKMQAVLSGLALEEAYAKINRVDSALEEKIDYAFDEKIGYLTTSPANLGTAMRASVMLHLPALAATGRISDISLTVSRLGIDITGTYGSRSQPAGDIYRVSNRITLGITEETAIANLKAIVLQIEAQERKAAELILDDPAREDKVFRALGLLQSARILNISEFMQLISAVRFGAARGLVDIPVREIDAMIIEMQPATVSADDPGINTVTAGDKKRADEVRKRLGRF